MKTVRLFVLAILLPGVVVGQGRTYSVSWVQILSWHGGNGGQPSALSCDSGSVVTGLIGNSGAYVDRLGVSSWFLQSDGTLGTAVTPKYLPGGNGGSPFQITCRPGEAAV